MRHRVFRPLRPAAAPDDILHFGDTAEEVFEAVIQAIHFLERRFGGEDRLHEERAFVELRHEVAADDECQRERRDRDCEGQHAHESRVRHAPVEQRCVAPFDRANDRNVFLCALGARTQQQPGRNRNEREREHQRRRDGRDHRGRERLGHAPFNARHREQRSEHRDDDERCVRDRPSHFDTRQAPSSCDRPCDAASGGARHSS